MWLERFVSAEHPVMLIIDYAKRNFFFVGVSVLALCACTVVFGALYLHFFLGGDIPKIAIENSTTASYWGQLGDFAGGFLNPLLSFLALMAVLKTMALQRSEMKAAQQEAKTATQEQRQQTAVYSKQMFESTLFGMLDVHSRILSDIKYVGPLSSSCSGRAAIDMIVKSFKESDRYQSEIYDPASTSDEVVQQHIDLFCYKWKSVVGHYFCNLYWIMKMIDSHVDGLSSEKGPDIVLLSKRRLYTDYLRKRNYTNILRAQLSDSEMALLQINCIGPFGADLKYYVERYSLLKPLGKECFGPWKVYMTKTFSSTAFVGLESVDMEGLAKNRSERTKRNTSAIRKNSFKK